MTRAVGTDAMSHHAATTPSAPSDPPTRVLFIGEAVTLAHVARPYVLARALHEAGDDVHVAVDRRYERLFADEPTPTTAIQSIPSEQFMRALKTGSPIFDADTLRRYVADDLRVIEQVQPDVVVGDLRLSLAVSAVKAGVPYLNMINAYWSPYAATRYPMPELPMTRFLPLSVARAIFHVVRPMVFKQHTKPLNRIRREYGLASLGDDLRTIYTWGDHTLYADVPELAPLEGLPEHHHFIGPVMWSPNTALPAWWDDVPDDQPIIYATFGSSGRADLMHAVLAAAADLPVTVIAATAGRVSITDAPRNALIADYLPGDAAAARASVVVCNGGSPTTHQALAAGTPVLGIASNMDQHLNMALICNAGAGLILRSDRADKADIRTALARLTGDDAYNAAAGRMRDALARYDAPSRLREVIKAVRRPRVV